MKINTDEIASVIKQEIDQFASELEVSEVGRVVEIGDGIARIYGLSKAMAGELLEFQTDRGSVMGQVMNLETDTVGAVIYGEYLAVKEGDLVKSTGRLLEVPVGESLLGRVVNPLGVPLDDGPAREDTERSLGDIIAPGSAERQPVHEPLQTGIKAIDAMIPIGRGQRELIIGDRKTGKTAVAIDAIINQKQFWGTEDAVVCIYVAVGQKESTVAGVVQALTDNGAMLSVIFFALLFGYFVTRTEEPHRTRVQELFDSLFAVVMRMAEGILKLLPYGVFALIVKVVASTGFAPFKALFLYMLTVAAALVLHACVTLPALLRTVGRMSPTKWFRAMSPALMTAFSTSSSSMTLPVTLKTVEQRGRVSNRITSFTLPLGATINMDGTALYECIGVIFLAQYYAAAGGYELTAGSQALVVLLALLASVGAAGIPSAGLVMMLTILSALKLPLEGAALLLAVDRPLDMLRTVVNVWSDSCAAAVVARSEGEEGPLEPALA